MSTKWRKSLKFSTHWRPSLESISYLCSGGMYTFRTVYLCKDRKLLLTEYNPAFTQQNPQSQLSIYCPIGQDTPHFLLLIIQKKKYGTPSPSRSSSHFPRPKIRRSLKEDFNRLTGNVEKIGGEKEQEQKKSFSTETEKDIIQRRVSSKTHVQSFFFLQNRVVAFSLAFLGLLFLFSGGF